ncbi:DUF397 domain-containing protein [Actinomadura sp. 3N407]|uniref:DUF397 domain-containing protein n=1 Tax=Actinomadura sp. 3N407 TaxID=3457423 RepID=UPI003FCCC183
MLSRVNTNPSTEGWRKSARNSEQSDACVELAATQRTIAIRDSNGRDGPKLLIGREEFRHFASVLKSL